MEVPGPWIFLSLVFHWTLSRSATWKVQRGLFQDAWLSSLGGWHHQTSQARGRVYAFLFSWAWRREHLQQMQGQRSHLCSHRHSAVRMEWALEFLRRKGSYQVYNTRRLQEGQKLSVAVRVTLEHEAQEMLAVKDKPTLSTCEYGCTYSVLPFLPLYFGSGSPLHMESWWTMPSNWQPT